MTQMGQCIARDIIYLYVFHIIAPIFQHHQGQIEILHIAHENQICGLIAQTPQGAYRRESLLYLFVSQATSTEIFHEVGFLREPHPARFVEAKVLQGATGVFSTFGMIRSQEPRQGRDEVFFLEHHELGVFGEAG